MELVADYSPMQFPVAVQNSAVGPEWEGLRTTVDALQNSVQSSVFWNVAILYAKAQTRLHLLESLKGNWDSYGAPAPNETAMGNATRILEHMTPFDLSAVKIIPSAEGGIGFCFVVGDRYADVEASNEGDILGVRYVGKHAPALIPIEGTSESIENALAQIRGHLSA
jgi:hypothetical protein